MSKQLTRRGTIANFANRSGKTSFFNGLLCQKVSVNVAKKLT